MKIVLAFRGEFGFKIYFHAPVFQAMEGPKAVFIEPGDEALYPSADDWIYVERREDSLRRATYRHDADYLDEIERSAREVAPEAEFLRPDNSWPKEWFVPRPHIEQGVGAVDVVVCPRKREYGASKNWEHWSALVDRLQAEGLNVFAAGAPDSSYEVSCARAWDHERFLDASIEAMHTARLVVATDAGLAHLATVCGRPLLMIAHGEGLVAPGPSADETGKVMDEHYWPIKLHRYEAENHRDAPLEVLDHAWFDLDRVVGRTLTLLG